MENKDIKIFVAYAFSRVEGGGNPAGVVFYADQLCDDEMRKIAAELGYSETAFISSSEFCCAKIRYFTPVEEVRLCGHATIAAMGLMLHQKMIEFGSYRIETSAGILTVLVEPEKIMLEMDQPVFFNQVDKIEIAESLGITTEDVLDIPSPQIVSTGLKDLIIPVKNIGVLRHLKPDFDRISAISAEAEIAGYHVYCYGDDGNIYMRNFAPLLGIPEESATGTASGALAVFLYKNGCFPKSSLIERTFHQGMFMGKPSEIDILLSNQQGDVKVFVGGAISDISLIK